MNNYYRGHGAAIIAFSYQLSYPSTGTLKINNCNFSYNKDAKSIVYLVNTHDVAMYYNNTF